MSYPGSKAQAGVWQRIIGQMPPHSVYVEAFFGSGQVFHRKRAASSSIVIDTDAGVLSRGNLTNINFFSEEDWIGSRLSFTTMVIQQLAINGNAIKIIPALELPDDAVIYCDPPYPLSTRRWRSYYKHEMTDEDHAALLSTLRDLKCRILISSYPNKLYSSQLRDWRCMSYKTRTRGRTLTECLWCNFPEPTELHDWRYAGKNFRERTGLKRLATRWLLKLDNMPERKRGYLLNAMNEVYHRGTEAQRA